MFRPSAPLRVLVAGGGFAAAEALLALRSYAGDRVSLKLVAPEPTFAFRPAAAVALFTDLPVERFDLSALTEQTGTVLHRDAVDVVAPDAKRVRLRSGSYLEYDALVLAIGARARSALPGALTFRDQRDEPQVKKVVEQLRDGGLDRLVLAVPAGVSWSLPVYELSLLAAGEAQRLGTSTEVSIVTPERSPLQVFGGEVSLRVAELLMEAGIRFVGGAAPRFVDRCGVRLADAGTVPAERVIAVPALVGRRLPGVPADFGGFVTTGAFGRVADLQDVYAAGDMTAFPVKQGGLAAQDAENIAAVLAAQAGADARMPALTRVLRAQLFGAPEPLFLSAELDLNGRPRPVSSAVSSEPPWWPPSTLVGRHVTPWMAAQSLLV